MNEPTTVTYDLAEVLKGIDNKLDKIDNRLTNLEVGQGKLTEKVEGMNKRLEKVENTQDILVKEVSDLKGIKSLIIPIIVAVITAGLTLFARFIPYFFLQIC